MSKPTINAVLDLDHEAFVTNLLAFHKAQFGDARMEDTGGDAGTAGATGDGAGAGAGAANAGAGTAGTGDAGTGAQGAPSWNPDAWDGKVESLPKAAQKMINDLRTADGDERVAKKTLDAIMAAINPEADGTKPDPAQLAQQLTDSQTEGKQTKDALRQSQVELTVFRTAKDHGGDPAALTDSRAFLAKVADLDPTAEDFRSRVIDAAKAAVTENATLKAARVATTSSVSHAGGSGEGVHDLDAQIAEATKKGDHALAIRLKRQKAYTQPTT